MNRTLKWLIIILLTILIMTGLYIIFQKRVISDISVNDNLAERAWHSLYGQTTYRISLIAALLEETSNKNIVTDNLTLALNENKLSRCQFTNRCSDEFVQLEYELNEKLLDFLDEYNGQPNASKELVSIVNDIKTNNISVNDVIEKYNNTVSRYNKSILLFPNSLISKIQGYLTRKFFPIKYGERNTDPNIS